MTRPQLAAALLTLASLAPLAWADDFDPVYEEPPAPPSLRVETWNVGLAHGFVDHAEARSEHIWQALADSDAHVICLQEVWEEDDRRAAIDAVADSHPFSYRTENEQLKAESAPACRIGDLFGEDRFVSCMSDACDGLEGDALTDCIIEDCGPTLDALKTDKPDCANALMAQVGKSAPAALWTVIRPFRKAGVFSYGGSDGLVLLSRLPLEQPGMVDFTELSTLNRRRALYADITTGDTTTRVYCTHLTADLDGVAPYPGPFASWNEENLTQAGQLLEHAQAFAGPTVLMGDFNCSDADSEAGIEGESAASCELLTDAGYADPMGSELRECTYCPENTLTGSDEVPVLLDHVFIKGWATRFGSKLYTQTVELDVGPTSLSDHYGYAVTLVPPVEDTDDQAAGERHEDQAAGERHEDQAAGQRHEDEASEPADQPTEESH